MSAAPAVVETTSRSTIPDAYRNIYQLHYISNVRSTHVTITQFIFNGPYKDAVARARLFCDTMRYRFISVKPFIIDLSIEEERHKKAEDPYA